MNDLLEILALCIGMYPLKAIYNLYRISKKRNSRLNMFGSFIFAVSYLTLLFILSNISLKFGVIAITILMSENLVKKYMALISHEENEKRLDSFEAFIKAYEQQKRSE